MPASSSPSHSLLSRRRRSGMSLVEIMIVIAIIGILTSVVAVNVFQSKAEADIDLTKLQIKKIEENLLMYSLKHHGKFPSTSEGLEAAKKYFPGEKVPVDAWGEAFTYLAPGTHGNNPYEIISKGADRKEGGEENNADIYSWDMGSGE